MKKIIYLILLLNFSVKLCSSEQKASLDSSDLFQASDDIVNQIILGSSNSEFTPIRIIIPDQNGTFCVFAKHAILDNNDEDQKNDFFEFTSNNIENIQTFINGHGERCFMPQTRFENWDASLYFICKQNEDGTFSPYSNQYKGIDFREKSIWRVNGYGDDSTE